MKWFKHDADANHDAKLEKVLMKYGADGYALFWLCLELIALPIDKSNVTFELEHDAEILAYRLKLDSRRVEEIMHYFIKLDLFEVNAVSKKITCLKLAERIENSIIKSPYLKSIQNNIKAKNPGSSGMIQDNSGKVRLDIDIDIDLYYKTSRFIFEKIKELNPKQKEPNYKTWNRTIRLMVERDNRTETEIRELFEWSNKHYFWKTNILSPDALRKQWDKLIIQKTTGAENETHNKLSAFDKSRIATAEWLKRKTGEIEEQRGSDDGDLG